MRSICIKVRPSVLTSPYRELTHECLPRSFKFSLGFSGFVVHITFPS